jgi:hypothetical protein
VTQSNRAALAGLVAGVTAVLVVEALALPTAWLPLDEAAALVHARGGDAGASGIGVLYPALLAPAARTLSAPAAYRFAQALSALLWALAAVPSYFLARRLLVPRTALVVAGLAVLAPGSVYATAAVPDALAFLLGVGALALAARASARGSERDLALALALAGAAALARPWYVVLPPALLVAYELPHATRQYLRWPRSLLFAAFAAFAYFVLASTAPEVGPALTAPGASARAAVASLVAVVLGTGVLPWLFVAGRARPLGARAETALFATCVPAFAVAAGVFGAAGDGVDERPLLVVVPLVLVLGASIWSERAVRIRGAAVAAGLLLAAALALPALGRAAPSRASGLALVALGDSRTALILGTAFALVAAAAALVFLRRRAFAVPALVAAVLFVTQGAAWSSARDEARAQPVVAHGWVDRHAGNGAHVFVAARAGTVDAPELAQLRIWNRTIVGTRDLDLSNIDPTTGLVPISDADVVFVRGLDVAGDELARSSAGILLRTDQGLRIPETLEGLTSDGWSGPEATFRRFYGPERSGTVAVVVSRVAWGDKRTPPTQVTIGAGEPAGEPVVRERFVLHPGEERTFDVPVPPPPFRVVVTVGKTFSPADYGSPDTRQLGAQVTFAYHPVS